MISALVNGNQATACLDDKETGAVSAPVLSAARSLSQKSNQLKELVARIPTGVRAAWFLNCN